MKNPKVAIIMSTYNGEKYIVEQLESLFSQTYKDTRIYIRDDGSTDNTVKILKKYATAGKIEFFAGKNLGCSGSFLEALEIAYNDSNDFFAFCDQDDRWHKDKVERIVQKISSKNQEKPIMYFSDVMYCDKELNPIKKSNVDDARISFPNSLVDIAGLGMSSAYNRKMVEEIVLAGKTDVYYHDIWPYMIAAGFGKVIHDHAATADYRRTGENVSPGGESFLKRLRFRIKSFFVDGGFARVKAQILKYKSCFYDRLGQKDQKFLELFTDKYNFKNAVKKAFYPDRLRESIVDDLAVRFLFLIGKL